MALKLTAAFLIPFFLSVLAPGQQSDLSFADDHSNVSDRADLPAVTPSGRPSIGLAFEGGGALGLAHIGVLQWLEDNRVPIDRISGTSMGSLVGGLYATGRSPAELRALASGSAITSVFSLQSSYADASFRRRQDRQEMPQSVTLGLKSRYALRNALLAGRGVDEFLSREFFSYSGQELDYDRLPIPFRCVATDLNTLEAVTFSGGPLSQSVRASISLPGIFPPAQGRNGHSLVDGGIVDNLPTDVLRKDLHADFVIAVYLGNGALSASDTGSIVGVLNRAFTAGIEHNVQEAEKLADVVIEVPIGKFSTTDYDKAGQLIEAGYKAAEKNRAVLQQSALNEADWQAYLFARKSRQLGSPGILRQVRIEGGESGAVLEAQRDMKHFEGKAASPQAISVGLNGVQADGEYEAAYETFPIPGSAAANMDTGVLVHLSKDPTGPPFLLVGPDGAAATSNITRGEIALRLIDQNLGGFGSEFRGSARIGYMTDLSAEYYRLLSPSGYFVQPEARILRTPVYIWTNQKRIAERFQQNLEAGLVAGRTVNNHLQIAAEWRAIDTRWSLRTGNDGGGYLNGTAQTGLLHITLDEAASGSISPYGFRVSASAGALYHAVASDNAPLVQFDFSATHSWREKSIFGLSGEINSYLRARVADPYRFTLGGPMHLSASSFDEYRGTDTSLARAGFLHRIAAMPTGLGHGLYAAFGYEAGEIWSPDHRTILRQDGTAGLVAATPLGVISLGVSVGDAGHRKVFLTIGRWF
jgi:NTE family protein